MVHESDFKKRMKEQNKLLFYCYSPELYKFLNYKMEIPFLYHDKEKKCWVYFRLFDYFSDALAAFNEEVVSKRK